MELLARSANVSQLARSLFGLSNARGDGPMFAGGKESAEMARRVCGAARHGGGVGKTKLENCNAAALAIVGELARLPMPGPSAAAASVLRHCLHEFGADEADILATQVAAEKVHGGEWTEDEFVRWLDGLLRTSGSGPPTKVLPTQGRALMDTARAVTGIEVGPPFASRQSMLRAIVLAALNRPITV
eukprot:20850-Chlamydomonas_euryale.AAC.2